MIFDAIRRFFNINTRPPEGNHTGSRESQVPTMPPNNEPQFHPFRNDELPLDIFDMDTDINRIHDLMNQQLQSMMESFQFMFGLPGLPSGSENGDHPRFFEERLFPFGIPGLPDSSWGSKDPNSGINVPAIPGRTETLEPREEVLKPQFRKSPDHKEDEDLDSLVRKEGPGVVLDILKPGHADGDTNSHFSSWLWNGQASSPISSSSTVTIYRNINGHSTYEKIIRHPDGRVDRTVIENDGSTREPLGPSYPLD